VALELRRLGINKVHPLVGGWHQWKKNGYPMEMPKDLIQQSGFSKAAITV
jgi:3-mercaptopyruvate sulfurtransferase SseA